MRWSVLALSITLPSLALAEGGSMILDCQIVTRCDTAGVCAPDRAQVRFTFEPIKVGPLGDGTYRLSYDKVSAKLTLPADDSPMTWSETGKDRQSLTLISETPDRRGKLLWHSWIGAGSDPTETRHLTCQGI